ncbi:MAG: apolipoprotein N-acyltransferase [Candidatus Cloacimonetes bacterium HGW-Cloacimonetes-3]|jgi:apolipoprotein N-acyltransferase|nr:MAG: apolipoprotein N-acyltransferase [Candidatus Cloacimonetes bacterium HGW-Cloacimonetes-3]
MPLVWIALSAVLISLSRLPLHLGWLVFVGWIPLLHFMDVSKCKLWKAAALFAVIYVGSIFYWIADVTPGGLVGVVVLYFLHYLLVFYLIKRIGDVLPKYRFMGFVAVLLSFEYLQNFGEMRFPWFNNAYSLADYTALIQIADVGGVILISGLILVINVLLYRVIKGHRKLLVLVFILLLAWLAYGYYCLARLPLCTRKADIAVMQPSIPQDEKWDQAFYDFIMKRYDELCARAAKDSTRLLIFPEAAVPDYLMHSQTSMQQIQELTRKYNLEIFTGFPHFIPAPASHVDNVYYYNAAALFKPDGYITSLYYKNILVPIGERMLWLDYFPILWKLQFGQANWEFGKELSWMQSGESTFSPSICYEIAFAGINQRMAIPKDKQTGSYKKSDYLINITNDAWFGTSFGPWLHGVMTKFRAVENRIQIYRSANTGISMIVDPLGRVQSKGEMFAITNITAPLYVSPRIPLYRKIAAYPIAIVFLAFVLSVISILGKKRRKEP